MANAGSKSAHRDASFVWVRRDRITAANSGPRVRDKTEQRVGVGCNPKQVACCREQQVGLTFLKRQPGEEVEQDLVTGNENSKLLIGR
jgi:hypothetical protein